MMGKYLLFIYVCLASSAYAEDLTCQTGTRNECVKADLCPQFVKDKEQLKSLARESTLYTDLISRLKRHICNKVEKQMCCTRTSLPSGLLSKIKDRDFVLHCHEDVQPFLELLSASNQTIGCCNEGELTPTFCGGDPVNPCQDACGDITCVKLVPDPHDSQYCSKSGKQMNVPRELPALGHCKKKQCPNKRYDYCPCCMSDTYRTSTCKKQCKCRCKCQKYKMPGLCDITSCAGCKKYDKKCNKEGETNTGTTKSPCLDGTYPGRWLNGQQIKGNFTDMQTCADAITNLYSFSWNHKTGECLSVNYPLCGFSSDQLDWCSSCPSSADPGLWLVSDPKLITEVIGCYDDCRRLCINGPEKAQCEGFSWNMKNGTFLLFNIDTPGELEYEPVLGDAYWCSA